MILCNLSGRVKRGGKPKKTIPQWGILAPVSGLQRQLVFVRKTPFLDVLE
jgi:hypothetical protein